MRQQEAVQKLPKKNMVSGDNMAYGQILAINQLREIEVASDKTLSIDYEMRPKDRESNFRIGFSIKCGSYPRKQGGLKYRDRESFEVIVGEDFPFQKPDIRTLHKRFSGFPHVQWGQSLCLYIAPDIEWLPADGMYGFIDRLKSWLQKAALNELDPIGAPLHPPVTYTYIGETSIVVVKKDTPKSESDIWYGLAHVEKTGNGRFDIVDWQLKNRVIAESEYVAAAILANKRMPFEFPEKISDLLSLLNENGILTNRVLLQLQIAAYNNQKGEPLLLIIGTPMRGIVGEELKQHLMVWYIHPDASDAFRLTVKKYSDNKDIQEIAEKVEKLLLEEWAEKCFVNWCRVLEDRPEVTNRRDLETPISVFQEKNVEIWGCGALGANVALSLARANVKKLKLIDNGIVTPGLLVRQPFFESDIGRAKVKALQDHIKMINPQIEIETSVSNILGSVLDNDKINTSADVVFDCTASNSVRYKMELSRKEMMGSIPEVFSMMLDANAEYATLVAAPSGYSGGTSDIYRKSKIAIKKDSQYRFIEDAFYSEKSDDRLFQPEPGCSSPTFIASAADVSAISNTLLNISAKILIDQNSKSGSSYFVKQPHFALSERISEDKVEKFTFDEDFKQVDPINGYEIRYSENAIREIYGYINQNKRQGNENSETGGIMWGEVDEVLKIIWVTEISPAPPDSKSSPDQFVCGIEGVKEMNEIKKKSTSGSIGYLGIWHTHPESEALPSEKDYNAVYNLLNESKLTSKKVFISIISLMNNKSSVGSYVFEKENFYEVILAYD